ncbi:hypothetical protein A2U01_0036398, partial [Trifolium medium]|nr:hypothetical protein [Trifolium medium]
MSPFKLNLLSVMIVAALLLSSITTMAAQSPASSPSKSQPPRKVISPSPAAVYYLPSEAPEPEAPKPTSSAAVLNRVYVAAGSATLVI